MEIKRLNYRLKETNLLYHLIQGFCGKTLKEDAAQRTGGFVQIVYKGPVEP